MKTGDASSCMEILGLFDEAIRANPTNAVLYLNKAAFLLQVLVSCRSCLPCAPEAQSLVRISLLLSFV